jgi:hypothetical protein
MVPNREQPFLLGPKRASHGAQLGLQGIGNGGGKDNQRSGIFTQIVGVHESLSLYSIRRNRALSMRMIAQGIRLVMVNVVWKPIALLTFPLGSDPN